MQRMNVVFPQPEGPMMAVIFPAGTAMEMLFTTSLPSKPATRPRVSRIVRLGAQNCIFHLDVTSFVTMLSARTITSRTKDAPHARVCHSG